MWVSSNTCKGSYSVHLAENPQPALKSLWRYLAGSHCLPGKDSTGCFRKFHLAFSGLILSPWTLSFFWRLAMSLPGPWVQETVRSLHSWVLPESWHFPGTHSFYRRGSDPSEIHPSITCACMLSHVWLFATPWALACQAPLSMEFPRQEYWSGFPFRASGHLPDPGIEPVFPALQTDSLPLSHWGSPSYGP